MLRYHLAMLLSGAVFLAAEIVARAAKRADVSMKELAICQGISVTQWSQQMHGKGHISFGRLFGAPSRFLVALLDELRSEWAGDTHTVEDVYQMVARLAVTQSSPDWGSDAPHPHRHAVPDRATRSRGRVRRQPCEAGLPGGGSVPVV